MRPRASDIAQRLAKAAGHFFAEHVQVFAQVGFVASIESA
jgi:hypothetical protein